MAETFSLDVQNRHVKGKQVRQLRRDNLIPAVIYGAGGQALSLSCPRRPLEILLAKAGGTHLVKLSVEGSVENALVREVHRDPIRRDLIHVDFLRVDLTKKLRAEVPLHFTGAPNLGNDLTLGQYMTLIQVECLPANIPDHIEINLSDMKAVGDHVTVGDLPAIENVLYLSDPSDVIVRLELSGGLVDEEEEAAATGAPEPELSIAKGKKEEDEEA